MYAFGGWTSDDGFACPLKTAEVYDPSSDKWRTIDDLSYTSADKAAGALNGRIFSIGGEGMDCSNPSSKSGPMNEVDVFDPAEPLGEWQREGSLPLEMFRFTSAAYDNNIFVFGGQSKWKYCDSINKMCWPVTNRTWGFRDVKVSDESKTETKRGVCL